MKLEIFTIVLNGMPWIKRHLPEFEKLPFPWRWSIAEGAADNVLCTRWCNTIAPGLSTDGTKEYLDSIAKHPNIRLVRKALWNGKLEMVNTAIAHIMEPCILMEVDSDECWTEENIQKVTAAFEANPTWESLGVPCHYFIGPDIVTVTSGCYGNKGDEWRRAWRFHPGQSFDRHEPPVLSGCKNFIYVPDIQFDHYAYATEAQVAFKEHYYRYPGAVKAWRRLQANTVWPARVGDFLPWVTDNAMCERINV